MYSHNCTQRLRITCRSFILLPASTCRTTLILGNSTEFVDNFAFLLKVDVSGISGAISVWIFTLVSKVSRWRDTISSAIVWWLDQSSTGKKWIPLCHSMYLISRTIFCLSFSSGAGRTKVKLSGFRLMLSFSETGTEHSGKKMHPRSSLCSLRKLNSGALKRPCLIRKSSNFAPHNSNDFRKGQKNVTKEAIWQPCLRYASWRSICVVLYIEKMCQWLR